MKTRITDIFWALTLGLLCLCAQAPHPGHSAGVGISGSTAQDMALLATATGTGASGTITFSSISQDYKDLIVVAYLRSDRAANNNDPCAFTLNNDTGSNYVRGYYGVNAGAAAQGQNTLTQAIDGSVPAATSTASRMSAFQVRIIDYTNTGGFKYVVARSIQENSEALQGYSTVTRWQNTGAVNRVDWTLTNGNFTTTSTARLWGAK